MQTRAARKAVQFRLRFPDELILLIIETCDYLETDREKTLAALCRIAKRHTAAAERVLYSRVELNAGSWKAHPVCPGTALYTLVQESRFRALVKSVTLKIDDRHAQNPQVASLLDDLPNVEEISLPGGSTLAGRRVLKQGSVQIRSLEMDELDGNPGALLQRYPAAFSTLTRIALRAIAFSSSTIPPSCTGITAFSVANLRDPRTFATFTSACASTLTHLCLPLKVELEDDSLVNFRNLKKLSLVNERLGADDFAGAVPHVESILASTASLTSFTSLAIEGVLLAEERKSSPIPRVARKSYGGRAPRVLVPASPSQVPASSRDILAAIPSQVQHLSLITSFVVADDVATFLLGPLRPPTLTTLRLGGGVGQGFKEFARTKSVWHADFERTMEQAGVELTTVE